MKGIEATVWPAIMRKIMSFYQSSMSKMVSPCESLFNFFLKTYIEGNILYVHSNKQLNI